MAGPYLNQGVFLSPLSENNATQREELGVLRYDSGNIYRYVLAGGTIVNGNAVKLSGSTGTTVIATAASTDNMVGVAETSLTSGRYGWITVYGVATVASVDTANVSAGTPLAPTGSSGLLVRYIASTAPGPVGGKAVALAAGGFAPNTSAVFLQCL